MSNAYWIVETHGDPLTAVRKFVQALWAQAKLDGMLAPLNEEPQGLARPRLARDPAQLEAVNPFKPLMTVNAARLLPRLLEEHSQRRLGALLRPCEMRALIEMAKHASFPIDRLLTISMDCLGTLPLEDYQWRLARVASSGDLIQQALQFARQGGIAAYRYRSACQVCASPEAQEADINIHVLGLPVRQALLVKARDQAIAMRLRLGSLTAGSASNELVRQHEQVAARSSERQQRTFERVLLGLEESLPRDVEAVVAQLESCGDCQKCMEVCPICAVDRPVRSRDGRYQRESIVRWLVSCSGCGMCEQACPNHLPLSIIFGHIRRVLDEEWNYTPGRSIDETLPAF